MMSPTGIAGSKSTKANHTSDCSNNPEIRYNINRSPVLDENTADKVARIFAGSCMGPAIDVPKIGPPTPNNPPISPPARPVGMPHQRETGVVAGLVEKGEAPKLVIKPPRHHSGAVL